MPHLKIGASELTADPWRGRHLATIRAQFIFPGKSVSRSQGYEIYAYIIGFSLEEPYTNATDGNSFEWEILSSLFEEIILDAKVRLKLQICL